PAAVRDRVRAPSQLLDGKLALLSTLAEVGDLLFDLGDRHEIRITQDRDDQPARATHRDADVVVAVIHDVSAVDRSVDRRKLLQRMHNRLDEEAHEAQLDLFLLLQALLITMAQIE